MKPYKHENCNLARGIKHFKCLVCGKESTNYMNGIAVYHECCVKNNTCQICGKEFKDNIIKDSEKNISINEDTVGFLKQLQKQSIEFKDILGTHRGIIHELKIKDNGIFAYSIFFGQNVWLRLNESTFKWEEIKE